MDTINDLPLRNVHIFNNLVRTDHYHRIALGNCIDCSITDNRVERQEGSLKKAVILPGLAKRCGNYAQDEKVQDAPCE